MRFFFYGTLLDGGYNSVAAWLHRRMELIGSASVAGVLEAVPDPEGWYPALLDGEGRVHGRLYETAADFGAEDLARLDAYEDYDPLHSASSLYLRQTLTVTLKSAGTGTGPGDSACQAQAYRFNRPLPAGARAIPHGDFVRWLAEEGLAPFGG